MSAISARHGKKPTSRPESEWPCRRFWRNPSSSSDLSLFHTVAPGQNYRISDLELASRLSYFLWSTVPDETIDECGFTGKAQRSGSSRTAEVKRMLLDPSRRSAVDQFRRAVAAAAGSFRKLTPESTTFSRIHAESGNSMRREVELLFDSVIREDRNIIDLLTADYTFVDEVLAKHYGIPNVLGSSSSVSR